MGLLTSLCNLVVTWVPLYLAKRIRGYKDKTSQFICAYTRVPNSFRWTQRTLFQFSTMSPYEHDQELSVQQHEYSITRRGEYIVQVLSVNFRFTRRYSWTLPACLLFGGTSWSSSTEIGNLFGNIRPRRSQDSEWRLSSKSIVSNVDRRQEAVVSGQRTAS